VGGVGKLKSKGPFQEKTFVGIRQVVGRHTNRAAEGKDKMQLWSKTERNSKSKKKKTQKQ